MEEFISHNLFQILGFSAMLVGLYVTSNETQTKLKSEIEHVKSDVKSEMSYLKEDVARLERKQEESNKLKERMVKQEINSETVWKRVDEMRLDIEEIKKAS